MEQRSQEWFFVRRGRVTASSIGAILGLDPYRDRDDVMRSMVREWHGVESEFTGNIATQWGQTHEAEARMTYEANTGRVVEECGFYTIEDWAGASPDGLVGDEGLIEIKCPFGIRNQAEPKFKALDEQPHYHAQIQFQLFATGRKWCDFFQWTPSETALRTVYADEKEQAKILAEARKFHEEFLQEICNPAHLEPPRKVIDTPTAIQLVREYDDLCDAEEQAKERRKEVLEQIVDLAGGVNAEIAGRKLTLVERKGSVSYAKALKSLAPNADLTPYTGKPSQSWKLS